MPPLPADSIHARACKLKCEKILTRPIVPLPAADFLAIDFSSYSVKIEGQSAAKQSAPSM